MRSPDGRLDNASVRITWSAVVTDLLRRIVAGTPAHPDENGFTYGLLYARELRRAADTRQIAAGWADDL